MKTLTKTLFLVALAVAAQNVRAEESLEPSSAEAVPVSFIEIGYPTDAEWTPTLPAPSTYADAFPDRLMQVGSAFPDDTVGLSE